MNFFFAGDKICKRIDDRLKKYCEQNNLNVDSSVKHNDCPKKVASEQTKTLKKLEQCDHESSKFKKKPNCKTYVPKYRSGGYAILIALFKAEQAGLTCLTKSDLIQRAQPYCNESMTITKQNSHYTCWSSITSLIKHEYVEVEKHRFSTYKLTQAGIEIAGKIIVYDENEGQNKASQMIRSDSEKEDKLSEFTETDDTGEECVASQIEKFSLSPETFEIILLIDSREQYSLGSSDLKKTAILAEFINRNLKCQMMKLPVGDFAWMVREKTSDDEFGFCSSQEAKKELMLDFVVERKRYDDLASSIKGGRWGEQKYRLLNCGLRRPIYLIEDFGSHRKSETLYQSMVQALSDAQIIDGLIVKQTDSYSETIDYLSMMTKYLEAYYKDRTLYSCSKAEIISKQVDNNHLMTFNEFNHSADKISNFTATEMFIKHLLKIRGVSVIKAKTIAQYYPTVTLLLEAYDICENDKFKESLLAEITYGQFEKKIGQNLSKKIYKYYTHQGS